jgi:hypothetical protein
VGCVSPDDGVAAFPPLEARNVRVGGSKDSAIVEVDNQT